MKNLTILSFLMFAAVSITACKKDSVDPQPQSAENFMIAKKGSAVWTSKMQETNMYNDSTFFFGNVGEEHLVMRIKFNGKGKYPLTVSQSRYMVTVGGDVVVAEYYVDQAAENVLNVTDYDASKKTYTGNFTLNLKLNSHYQQNNNPIPETIAFTNGSFKITAAK